MGACGGGGIAVRGGVGEVLIWISASNKHMVLENAP